MRREAYAIPCGRCGGDLARGGTAPLRPVMLLNIDLFVLHVSGLKGRSKWGQDSRDLGARSGTGCLWFLGDVL